MSLCSLNVQHKSIYLFDFPPTFSVNNLHRFSLAQFVKIKQTVHFSPITPMQERKESLAGSERDFICTEETFCRNGAGEGNEDWVKLVLAKIREPNMFMLAVV